MDPGKSNGPGRNRAATNNTTCRDATTTPHEIASRAYERGFCDGWRDRAEYERRARLRDSGLTFAEVLQLGYELGRQDRYGS